MTSQKDRVVRVRMLLTRRCLSTEAEECSLGSACRRGIVARCVLLFLHDERETSERCLVLFEANPCSNSDLCSCREQFNRIDRWSTALDLAERDRWTECSWSDRLSV